jgi:DNA end-binding protein Ku
MAARKTTHGKRKQKLAETEADGKPEKGEKNGAGRATWSGSISFGLLQIPITLHPAEARGEEIYFRMLDKEDLAPIRLERVNSTTGKKVEWRDIVKGYEVEPDTFVVMEPEDLKKANVQKTQTIDIQDFVPRGQIDPTFFETPYFVLPQARAEKAYVLLREALTKKDAVAIATFVLRTREHLCAVMPVGDALLLEILRFGHELKAADDLDLPKLADAGKINKGEMEMAVALVDGMMTDFEPKNYQDRYFGDVMKIIEEKAKTGEIKEHHAKIKGEVASDVVDLLPLLKKSLAERGKKGRSAA